MHHKESTLFLKPPQIVHAAICVFCCKNPLYLMAKPEYLIFILRYTILIHQLNMECTTERYSEAAHEPQ